MATRTPVPETETVMVSVRLSSVELARLDAYAKASGLNRSEAIRASIRAYEASHD